MQYKDCGDIDDGKGGRDAVKTKARSETALLLLAFFLPLLIILFSFVMLGIAPFGDYSLAIIDAKQQYVPFSVYWAETLKNGYSLLYSWKEILGGPIAGLFGYYLASPFELLFLFCTKENALAVFDLMVAMKLALCGFSMSLFFRERSVLRLSTLLFTTSYALCGFNLVLGWCCMWVDAVYMLPLIAMGLHRVAEKKSPVLYIISLGLSIIFNYYIGFMLCIFSLMFFLFLRMCQEDRIKLGKKDAVFVLSSVGAASLSAVLLLPVICAMQGSMNYSVIDTIRLYTYPAITRLYQLLVPEMTKSVVDKLILPTLLLVFGIFVGSFFLVWKVCRPSFVPTWRKVLYLAVFIGWIEFWHIAIDRYVISAEYLHNGERTWVIHKLFFGRADFDEICIGSANIFVGPLIILLAAAFFCNKSIKKREKGASLFILLLFFVSFVLFFPNNAWHMLAEPHFFNFRYSFCLSSLMIMLAEKAWRLRDKENEKHLPVLFAAIGVAGLLSVVLARKYLEPKQIAVDLLILCLSGVSLFLLIKREKQWLAAVCGVLQMFALGVTMFSVYAYQAYELSLTQTEYRELVKKGSEKVSLLQTYDGGMYRTRNAGDWLSKNDPMFFGFLGSSHFSSAEKKEKTDFMSAIGVRVFESRWASGNYSQSRAADSLLGVRYMFVPFADYLPTSAGTYRNPYDLSLAMIVPEQVTDVPFEPTAAETLNRMYRAMGSDDELFTELLPSSEKEEKGMEKLTYSLHDRGFFYLQMKGNLPSKMKLLVNGMTEAEYEDTWKEDFFYPNQLMLLGEFSKGDCLEIWFEPRGDNLPEVGVYQERTEILQQISQRVALQKTEMQVFDEANLNIVADVVEDGQVLMISIPYDRGWSVSVDGYRTETESAFGELLAIPLAKGEHLIEMHYFPRGLRGGIVLSGSTLLVMLIWCISRRRKKGAS